MRRSSRLRPLFVTLLLAVVVVPTALQFVHVQDATATAGDHLWSKRFGDANYQAEIGVAVDGTPSSRVTSWARWTSAVDH